MSLAVSIVISMYNKENSTLEIVDKLLLPSLINNSSKDIELILLDDKSPLGGATDNLIIKYNKILKNKFGKFTYIKNKKNHGFAGSYNKGLKLAKGKLILMANDDVYFPEDSIKELCKTLNSDKKIGAVGPVTNYASSFQNTHLFKKLKSYSKQEINRIEDFAVWIKKIMHGKVYYVDMLIGFCVVYKKSILQQCGYLDTNYKYGNFEDNDLHEAIKNKNYLLVLNSGTFVEHGGLNGGSMSMSQHPIKVIKTYFINAFKFGLKHDSIIKTLWTSTIINLIRINDLGLTITSDIKKRQKQFARKTY